MEKRNFSFLTIGSEKVILKVSSHFLICLVSYFLTWEFFKNSAADFSCLCFRICLVKNWRCWALTIITQLNAVISFFVFPYEYHGNGSLWTFIIINHTAHNFKVIFLCVSSYVSLRGKIASSYNHTAHSGKEFYQSVFSCVSSSGKILRCYNHTAHSPKEFLIGVSSCVSLDLKMLSSYNHIAHNCKGFLLCVCACVSLNLKM